MRSRLTPDLDVVRSAPVWFGPSMVVTPLWRTAAVSGRCASRSGAKSFVGVRGRPHPARRHSARQRLCGPSAHLRPGGAGAPRAPASAALSPLAVQPDETADASPWSRACASPSRLTASWWRRRARAVPAQPVPPERDERRDAGDERSAGDGWRRRGMAILCSTSDLEACRLGRCRRREPTRRREVTAASELRRPDDRRLAALEGAGEARSPGPDDRRPARIRPRRQPSRAGGGCLRILPRRMSSTVVMKFGGTSVADAERLKRAAAAHRRQARGRATASSRC